jgi:signal transduction histidine kinase
LCGDGFTLNQPNSARPKSRSSLARTIAARQAALLALLLLCFSTAVFIAAREYLYSELDRHLHRDAEAVQQSVEQDTEGNWQFREIRHSADDPFDTDPHFELWSLDGRLLADYGPRLSSQLTGQLGVPGVKRQYFTLQHERSNLRVGIEEMTVGTGSAPQAVRIRVYRSESDLRRRLWILGSSLSVITLAVIGLGLMLSWKLSAQVLLPLARLVQRAESVGNASLHSAVQQADAPSGREKQLNQDPQVAEVVALSSSLDAMLARLAVSYARLEGFASDCAHELRTPLAALRARAEEALSEVASQDGSTALRSQLEDILELCDRLTMLIARLLSLARAESEVPACSPTDLRIAAANAVELVLPLLEERGQQLTWQGNDSLWAMADSMWIEQITVDLLHNASRYAPAGRPVTLSLHKDAGEVVLSVHDFGSGLPGSICQRIGIAQTGAVPHADTPSAAHAAGSTQLGLRIVTRITELMGGRVTAHYSALGGSAVEIRLRPAQACGLCL